MIYEHDIPRLEREGLDFLYELEKPSNNLFFADFDEGYSDTKYRISSVRTDLPSLGLELDNNKNIVFKNGDYNLDITVDWIEDAYRSVEKFHNKWFNQWYNFHNDFLYIGRAGKFKTLSVYAYHYVNLVTNNSKIPVSAPDKVLNLRFVNCTPFKIPGFEFKWGETSQPTYTVTYKCSYVLAQYFNTTGDYLMNKDLISGMKNAYIDVLGAHEHTVNEENITPKPELAKTYINNGGWGNWESDKGKPPFSSYDWKRKEREGIGD